MSNALEAMRDALRVADDTDSITDALGAVRTYLHEQGLTFQDTEALLKLMGALQDHQRGKPNPLLARVGNARNKPHLMDSEFQAATAATMTLIQRCPGESKRTASERIAKRFKAAGIGVDAATIEGWHRDICSRPRKSDQRKEAYRHYVRAFGEPDAVKAEAMLDTLIASPRQKL